MCASKLTLSRIPQGRRHPESRRGEGSPPDKVGDPSLTLRVTGFTQGDEVGRRHPESRRGEGSPS